MIEKQTKGIQTNKLLYLNTAILAVLFLVACFYAWVAIIAFSYMFVCALCDNVKNGISYVLFSIPFLWLCLPYTAVFFILALVGWIIKLIILKNKTGEFYFKFSKKTILFFLLFIIYCFIPFSGYFNVNTIIKVLIFILIFCAILLLIKFPKDLRGPFNLRVIALGVFLASLMGLLRPYSLHLQDIIGPYTVNGFVRYSALCYNTNTLALICGICLSIFIYYLITNRCTKKDIFTFFVFTICGFSTLSKTFIIIMSVIILMLLIYAFRLKSKIIWYCIGLFCIEVIIITILEPNYIITYLKRFDVGFIDSNTSVDDALNLITTSRYDLWIEYLNFIVSNPLILIFGRSLAAPIIGIYSPHNIYISSIYQIGIVGTLLFVFAIIFFIKDILKQVDYKIDKKISTVLILFALIAFVEDIIFTII